MSKKQMAAVLFWFLPLWCTAHTICHSTFTPAKASFIASHTRLPRIRLHDVPSKTKVVMNAEVDLPNFSRLNIQLFNSIAEQFQTYATTFQLMIPLEEIGEDSQAARECDAIPSRYLFNDDKPASLPSPFLPEPQQEQISFPDSQQSRLPESQQQVTPFILTPKDLLTGGYFRRYGSLFDEAKAPLGRFEDALNRGMPNGYKTYVQWCRKKEINYLDFESLEKFIQLKYEGSNIGEVEFTFKQSQDNWGSRGRNLYKDFEQAQVQNTDYKAYYSYDFAACRKIVNDGSSLGFYMDSRTSSKENSQSWSRTSISGRYNWFSASGSVEERQLTEKLSEKHVKVTGDLFGVGVAAISKNKGSWYDIGVMDYMKNPSFKESYWADPTKYSFFFGKPDGTLLLYNDGLILCGGLTTTITVECKLTIDEQRFFDQKIGAGVWPYFRGNTEKHTANSWHYDDNTGITVTTTVGNKDDPDVYALGLRVADIFSV